MNKQLAKSIGAAAREARKALQLTQEDAAERIRVSVEFYARIERATSLPSIGTFARMVSALGVSADLLLGRLATTADQPAQPSAIGMTWAPAPPSDGPEVRRLIRRLRKARSSTLRLVAMMVKELEDAAVSNEQTITSDEALSSEPARELSSELSSEFSREPSSAPGRPSPAQSVYAHEGAMAR